MTVKPRRHPHKARVAFIERQAEITRRLQRLESLWAIWSDLFGKTEPAPIAYSHFAKLVTRYLPDSIDQTRPRRRLSQTSTPQPKIAATRPYDPAISPLGPQPLPPPLPKMPTVIRPGPVQPSPTPSDTGPPPGSNEWKKLHGIETSTRPRELIRQRVPDGKLAGDEK